LQQLLALGGIQARQIDIRHIKRGLIRHQTYP